MKILSNIKDKEQSFLYQITHQELPQQFHYDISKQASYENRLEVKNNGIESSLGEVIEQYMAPFEISESQKVQLDHLKNGAKVVIGGQQAGLLVSPTYTIHKIISIIILAKEQSKKLGQPIVPVFWIAGEDHDFDEVNHAYIVKQPAELKKLKYYQHVDVTDSVSSLSIEKDNFASVIDQFISQLNETTSTKEIYKWIQSLPQKSIQWTDQFALLIQSLFKHHGLLLIDSHFAPLRKLEVPIFEKMINAHETIHESFIKDQEAMYQLIQEKQIITDSNVHLFVSFEGKRELLKYDGEFYILGKSDVRLTKSELLNMLHDTPERFSNNVVTRPLMQEMLFNTLAFIGGPSEVKYWGELKSVFECFDMKMPLVVPRMRMTYVNDQILKYANKFEFNLEDIIVRGIGDYEKTYVFEKEDKDLLNALNALKHQIDEKYLQLSNEMAESIELKLLLGNNVMHHQAQFDYFNKHYKKMIKRQYHHEINAIRTLEYTLHPRNGLQERTMHPLQLLNQYGTSLFDDVLNQFESYTFDHLVIQP